MTVQFSKLKLLESVSSPGQVVFASVSELVTVQSFPSKGKVSSIVDLKAVKFKINKAERNIIG